MTTEERKRMRTICDRVKKDDWKPTSNGEGIQARLNFTIAARGGWPGCLDALEVADKRIAELEASAQSEQRHWEDAMSQINKRDEWNSIVRKRVAKLLKAGRRLTTRMPSGLQHYLVENIVRPIQPLLDVVSDHRSCSSAAKRSRTPRLEAAEVDNLVASRLAADMANVSRALAHLQREYEAGRKRIAELDAEPGIEAIRRAADMDGDHPRLHPRNAGD